MGGVRKQDIKRKVKKETEDKEDVTILIIQGEGNDLERIGIEEQ